MKIISIFTLVFSCLSFFSQDGSYNDGFSFTHKASEMGLKGNVKHVSQFDFQLDDQHLLNKGVTNWQNTKVIHTNFNSQGNLISMYQVSQDQDTNVITFVEYTKNHQIEQVSTYYTSYGKTFTPSNLSNWTKDKTTFSYENDRIVAGEYIGASYHKRGNSRLTISYDKLGRRTQKNVISTEGDLDTLYVNKYEYLGETDKISQLKISHCEKKSSGTVIYNYNSDTVLVSKKFTPETYSLQEEWNSEEDFWKFDSAGNCIEQIHGDSLKWPVYIYNKSTFNAKNDITHYTRILDYDGIGHSQYNYSYEYDDKQNWVKSDTQLITHKRYGYGETGTPDEFYKSERKIIYFDE